MSPYYVDHVFADPGDLLFTIEDPGLKRDLFRSSVDTVGDNIVVGALGKSVNNIPYAGGLYVFDGNTGSLLFIIDNPEPDRGDEFGRHMITTDNNIVVGLSVENLNDVSTKGLIHVFDGNTGTLLYTIKNPNGEVNDGWFGSRIGSIGDNVISSSNFQNSDGTWSYVTYVFDDKTGSLLYTLGDYVSKSSFGYSFASLGDSLAVFAPDEDQNDDVHTNTIRVFDANTGTLQYIIDNPDPTKGHFGKHLAEVNGNLVVGTPTYDYDDDNLSSGFIYVFDGNTGSLLYTIDYPQENYSDPEFGAWLVSIHDNIALRSVSHQTDHDSFLPLSDVIYVFDGNTGSLLLTIDEPELKDQNSGSFIAAVGSTGNLVVSGMNTVEKYSQLDPVYVFEGFPETISSGTVDSFDDFEIFVITTIVAIVVTVLIMLFLFNKMRR